MATIIIALILLAYLIWALGKTKDCLKGGGCCGGTTSHKERTMLINPKEYQFHEVYHILGMHCEQCEIKLERMISKHTLVIAKANAKKGTLNVYANEVIPTDMITSLIRQCGYETKI